MSLSEELINQIDDIKEKITNQEYITMCKLAHKIYTHMNSRCINNDIEEKIIDVNFHFLDGKGYNTTIRNHFSVNFLWTILYGEFQLRPDFVKIMYNGSYVRQNYQTITERFGDIDEINLYIIFNL
jgi:hypothetical protein|tara:strand:- start:203 stop:580 length:378 start_codon:yes stop_codon:yes gene_type:complete